MINLTPESIESLRGTAIAQLISAPWHGTLDDGAGISLRTVRHPVPWTPPLSISCWPSFVVSEIEKLADLKHRGSLDSISASVPVHVFDDQSIMLSFEIRVEDPPVVADPPRAEPDPAPVLTASELYRKRLQERQKR
jgi:hypothetical protein